MPPLAFTVDSLDGLDEAHKSLYTEAESGGYQLAVEGLPQVEDTTGLKTALQAEREARKQAEKQIKEAQNQAAEEAARIAAEKGDFEQLYKSAMQKLEGTSSELDGLRSTIANKERTATATKLAGELADGPNAELLAEFIGRRLQYADDAVKVLDPAGNLSVASLDDLKKEFSGDARYSALLRGNQASGGGATGGTGGGTAAKSLNREQFAALDPAGQMAHVKAGGAITE